MLFRSEHLNGISLSVNNEVIGSEVEVLVSEMDGSHGKGRSRDFRLVHFEAGAEEPRPGDLVNVRIGNAKPHFIFSDGAPLSLTRTRGGDAFQNRKEEAETRGVMLGIPSLRSVPIK